jgi:hypothetical protein
VFPKFISPIFALNAGEFKQIRSKRHLPHMESTGYADTENSTIVKILPYINGWLNPETTPKVLAQIQCKEVQLCSSSWYC